MITNQEVLMLSKKRGKARTNKTESNFQKLCSYLDKEIINNWDDKAKEAVVSSVLVEDSWGVRHPTSIGRLKFEDSQRLLNLYRAHWSVEVETRGFLCTVTYWTFTEKK